MQKHRGILQVSKDRFFEKLPFVVRTVSRDAKQPYIPERAPYGDGKTLFVNAKIPRIVKDRLKGLFVAQSLPINRRDASSGYFQRRIFVKEASFNVMRLPGIRVIHKTMDRVV